jgi:hypothetical protein
MPRIASLSHSATEIVERFSLPTSKLHKPPSHNNHLPEVGQNDTSVPLSQPRGATIPRQDDEHIPSWQKLKNPLDFHIWGTFKLNALNANELDVTDTSVASLPLRILHNCQNGPNLGAQ